MAELAEAAEVAGDTETAAHVLAECAPYSAAHRQHRRGDQPAARPGARPGGARRRRRRPRRALRSPAVAASRERGRRSSCAASSCSSPRPAAAPAPRRGELRAAGRRGVRHRRADRPRVVTVDIERYGLARLSRIRAAVRTRHGWRDGRIGGCCNPCCSIAVTTRIADRDEIRATQRDFGTASPAAGRSGTTWSTRCSGPSARRWSTPRRRRRSRTSTSPAGPVSPASPSPRSPPAARSP